MSVLLARGKYVVVPGPSGIGVIEDAAVLIEGDRISKIGAYADLALDARIEEVVGSSDSVVIPGLTNAHHHIGVTPTQLGIVDRALEPWLVARRGARELDLYLDTVVGALELVASGVTTVEHLQGRLGGPVAGWLDRAGRVLQAYLDVGLRVAFAPLLRDRGLLVYGDDDDFLAKLPAGSQDEARSLAETAPASEQFEFSRTLWDTWHAHPSGRVRIDFAPSNIHSCSDDALSEVADTARSLGARVHMHLLETARQREFARRRWGTTAVEHLRDLGVLSDRLTVAHAVWVSDTDTSLLAQHGVIVAHNPSSNLRLGSGMAPVGAMRRSGVPIALGIDEAGLNDDHDLFCEMRLAHTLHRSTGDPWNVRESAEQVLNMATRVGARSAGFGDRTGELAPGRQADLVVLDRTSVEGLSVEGSLPVAEQIVRRARPSDVRVVIVAGKIIYRLGLFTRLDAEAARHELRAQLKSPLREDERRRAALAARVANQVERYYEDWPGPN